MAQIFYDKRYEKLRKTLFGDYFLKHPDLIAELYITDRVMYKKLKLNRNSFYVANVTYANMIHKLGVACWIKTDILEKTEIDYNHERLSLAKILGEKYIYITCFKSRRSYSTTKKYNDLEKLARKLKPSNITQIDYNEDTLIKYCGKNNLTLIRSDSTNIKLGLELGYNISTYKMQYECKEEYFKFTADIYPLWYYKIVFSNLSIEKKCDLVCKKLRL